MSQEGTTQGDPLAMAMYAISTVPPIHRLSNESIKQAWFADDASAAGNLSALRQWWNRLVLIGPEYGYYPNAPKTWLIVQKKNPSPKLFESFKILAYLSQGKARGIWEQHLAQILSRQHMSSCSICLLYAWIV